MKDHFSFTIRGIDTEMNRNRRYLFFLPCYSISFILNFLADQGKISELSPWRTKAKSVNFLLGWWRNSAYSCVPLSILCNWTLSTNNNNSRKSFPERREGATIITAIVTKHSTSSLDSAHQPNQALHSCHFVYKTKTLDSQNWVDENDDVEREL